VKRKRRRRLKRQREDWRCLLLENAWKK